MEPLPAAGPLPVELLPVGPLLMEQREGVLPVEMIPIWAHRAELPPAKVELPPVEMVLTRARRAGLPPVKAELPPVEMIVTWAHRAGLLPMKAIQILREEHLLADPFPAVTKPGMILPRSAAFV